MKAKNGVNFGGIDIISDREGIIQSAIEKVYPLVFAKQQLSVKDYLDELRSTKRENVPNDMKKKFEAFLETLKINGISGNEAIQTLKNYNRVGFFGEELELAYLGKREYEGDKKKYKMMSLMRTKNETTQGEGRELYLFDTETLKIDKVDPREVKRKLDSGEYVYEDEKHKMPGIEEEK